MIGSWSVAVQWYEKIPVLRPVTPNYWEKTDLLVCLNGGGGSSRRIDS